MGKVRNPERSFEGLGGLARLGDPITLRAERVLLLGDFVLARTEPLYLVRREPPGPVAQAREVLVPLTIELREVAVDVRRRARRHLGERRRSLRPPLIERRHIDRRHRDVTRELQSSGWALVRRPVAYTVVR